MILSTGSAYLFCPIELEISANSAIQLDISAIQLDISAIQGINVKTARHTIGVMF